MVSGCSHVSRKERIDDHRGGHASNLPGKNCAEDKRGHAGKNSAADLRSKCFLLTANALSTPENAHSRPQLLLPSWGTPGDLEGLVRGSTGPWRHGEH